MSNYVAVSFVAESLGAFTEIYDLDSPEDMAAWKDNVHLSCAVQTGVLCLPGYEKHVKPVAWSQTRKKNFVRYLRLRLYRSKSLKKGVDVAVFVLYSTRFRHHYLKTVAYGNEQDRRIIEELLTYDAQVLRGVGAKHRTAAVSYAEVMRPK